MPARHPASLAVGAALFLLACGGDSPTANATATAPTDHLVFADSAMGVTFQPDPGMSASVLQRDTVVKYNGKASLRVNVPTRILPVDNYAGGVFVASTPRNLTRFNALTFWARASVNVTINQLYLGTDPVGQGQYPVERFSTPFTTTWQKYVLPLPPTARLTAETMLFGFAAKTPSGGPTYTVWFDDVQFEQLSTITNPRADIGAYSLTQEVGLAEPLLAGYFTAAVSGTDVMVRVGAPFFDWQSSNPAAATVGTTRTTVSFVGAGTANVTATLGTLAATGTRTYAGVLPPTTSPAAPTRPAGQVLSVFSGAYTNVAVSSWAMTPNTAATDVTIAGNVVKRYRPFDDTGILLATPVDLTTKTMHIDVFVHDATSFTLGLTDVGPDGVLNTADDSEGGVFFRTGDLPPLTAGAWNSLDIPLSAFTGLTNRNRLALIYFFSTSPTGYIDNVYFY